MARTLIRPHITIRRDRGRLLEIYPLDVQMYTASPGGNYSLFDFKEAAIERLIALQLVETIAQRHNTKSATECRIILMEKLYERGLDAFAKLINNEGYKTTPEEAYRVRRRDHVSHFTLKLIFSIQRDRKVWFSKQEVRLFRWRVSSLDDEVLELFIKFYKLQCIPVSNDQKQALKDELKACTPEIDIDSESFYMVQYSIVTNLVNTRKVFLRRGMAYVPRRLMHFVLVAYFKRSFIAGFEPIRNTANDIKDDDRLISFFREIFDCVKRRGVTVDTGGDIKVEDLDKLSKSSYPLCMRQLHEAVKTIHHLRDGGRVQYGLFLKGIGLRWEDAMYFWREEFIKGMDEETFDKTHGYHFRHLYGQEGRRADYQPFNCHKIMQAVVGPNEYHGCPFKLLPSVALTDRLEKYGLHKNVVEEIVEMARGHQYTAACKRYYEVTHHCTMESEVVHPNLYFQKSRDLFAARGLEPSSEEDDDELF